MVFVGKCVDVFLFLVYDVLQAFVDRRAAVSNLLQHGLKDDHIPNHRILQHVNLQDTENTCKQNVKEESDLFTCERYFIVLTLI